MKKWFLIFSCLIYMVACSKNEDAPNIDANGGGLGNTPPDEQGTGAFPCVDGMAANLSV